jgi:hypothetical protein
MNWKSTLLAALCFATGLLAGVVLFRNGATRPTGEVSTAGAAHDQGAQSLAQQIVRTDPAAAARWVDTIQDENIWKNSAQQVAWQWLRVNAEAAKKWVAQSQFTEDFKNNFARQKP